MQKLNFEEAVEELAKQDARYHADAYVFVRDVLDFTMKMEGQQSGGGQHVCGQQLIEGFRQLALQEYGPMVPTVLEAWGVSQCQDIGQLVFNLIEAGIFGKTESDSMDDFDGGYDFEEAFVKPFLPAEKEEPRRVEGHEGVTKGVE